MSAFNVGDRVRLIVDYNGYRHGLIGYILSYDHAYRAYMIEWSRGKTTWFPALLLSLCDTFDRDAVEIMEDLGMLNKGKAPDDT